MQSDEEAIRTSFCDIEQGHVFRFWDDLSTDEHKALLAQLSSIDVEQLAALIERHLAGSSAKTVPSLGPASVVPLADTEADIRRQDEWRERGEEALRAGDVGILIVAGGQATRLGFDGPKGALPVTPVTKKSLFQVHFEKVRALRRRYGTDMPLILLTSPQNRSETELYLQQHEYFGIPEGEIYFVEQGMLPAVDRDGRLLLAGRGRIFLSPDGHGGLFRALHKSTVLEELEQRGIRSVFTFQVDNPLVKVADPVFLGTHLSDGADLSLKVVRKRDPHEKVGLYVMVDGRPGVIEYSELDDEICEARDDDGELKFWAGNIAIHLFDLEFIKTLADGKIQLPYHMARKKIPYLDESGELQQPSELNGIKFESFLFDAIPLAQWAVAVEIHRSEEFAPVKNRSGDDSRQTAIDAQSKLFRSWLRDAGIPIEAEEALVEIGPLFSLDREELVRKIREDGFRGARKVLLD